MQKLTVQQRASILSSLVEGNSARATVRITGISLPSVLAYMVKAGEALHAFHDKTVRGLVCDEIQLDEIWSFVGCRETSKKRAEGKHPGDVWTWTSLCAKSKMIPAWRVGDRSMRTGYAFCADLSERVSGDCQITSDGHPVYRSAVPMNFPKADFAMLIKIYGTDAEGKDVVIGTEKKPIQGNPDMDRVSTSFVERSNLTIRMGNRRFTRLTNAFSKKLENHAAMLAITFTHYNFCRKHITVKATPAQAAGIADHQFTIEELVGIVEEFHKNALEARFEAAFAAKYDAPRKFPKSYTPTPKAQLELPWYLNPESDGEPEGEGDNYNH